MSGIARLLLRQGREVSGSDLKETEITDELKKLGVRIFIGHSPLNICGAEVVVYSSAIKEDNPEMQQAKKQGALLKKRAEALADLMKDKIAVTITGSHGKTTTTSLISCLLLEAGFSPTVAIGGILKNIDSNAAFGEGDFFVAEADESDGSFLYFQPRYSVITNTDYEHLDYYKEFKNEVNAFREFINRTEKGGCVFCCNEDANLKNILKDYKNRYVLFGLKNGADVYPKNIEQKGLSSDFDCFSKSGFLGRFSLTLGGMHNISNALAVIALGLELGIGPEVIKRTLANYKGAGRRLEVKFHTPDYLVIDDYAHHPTEIRASLQAIKSLKSKRIIAIFQPHRYTRTRLLLDELSRSFDLADFLILTDIYPASELPLEGVTSKRIYDKIKEHTPDKKIIYIPKEEIVAKVLEIMQPHDLIVTLGAGDIVKNCDELVEELKRQSKS